MENAVETKDLRKEFGELTAVDDVTVSLENGELFGLLGPNGSGKTTIVRMLTGQMEPTRGSAQVLGIDVQENPIQIREVTGIMPEQESPPSFLTAEEYLHFVAEVRKLENQNEKCEKWFEFLEFEDEKNVLCKNLSRGTRQKLMFSQAFLHEPNLVFLDEPLINLDPIIQRKIKDYLLDFVNEGKTVFFCTHVLEIAEEICTRIGILEKGRILHQGSTKELKGKMEGLEDFFLKSIEEG